MKNFKILGLMLALLGINSILLGAQKEDTGALEQVTPATTAFVFDAHDVMLRKSKTQIAKVVATALCNFVLHPIDQFTFVGRVGEYFYTKKRLKQDVPFETIALRGKTDDQGYVDRALYTMNIFKQNEKTCELIRKLHANGYDIHGCSNIGKYAHAYEQRLGRIDFKLFKSFYTTDLDNPDKPKKSDPNNMAFITAAQSVILAAITDNKPAPTRIYVIDDKKAYINQAQKVTTVNVKDQTYPVSYTGIRFESADQLEQYLVAIGALKKDVLKK
jgi:hypothetical protein